MGPSSISRRMIRPNGKSQKKMHANPVGRSESDLPTVIGQREGLLSGDEGMGCFFGGEDSNDAGNVSQSVGRQPRPAAGWLRFGEQSGFPRIGLHAVDADCDGGRKIETDQFRAETDDVPVAAGGKFLVLEFFNDTFGFEVGNAGWAHERRSPDDAGKLIGAVEALFEIGRRLYVVDDAPAVTHDCADIGRIYAFGEQFRFRVFEMLLRKAFVVIVVEKADGSPVFDLLRCLAEVSGKCLHAATYIRGVDNQMRGGCRC